MGRHQITFIEDGLIESIFYTPAEEIMSTVTLNLEPGQAKLFAYGDLEGYKWITTVADKNDMYKDYIPASTIAVDANGDHWMLNWSQYASHYGSGESDFPDDHITLVIKVETTKTITETNWVPVHEQ